MLRVLLAASVLTLAIAAPARAAPELASIFESITETAEAIEVEPPAPIDWFPVRGLVDFGEPDARFGAWRGGRRHEGQDVFAKAGTPLVAMRSGTVVETGDDGGRGNYIALWSPQTRLTMVYLHMRSPTRCEGGRRGRRRPARGGRRLHGLVLGRPPAPGDAHGEGDDGQADRPAARAEAPRRPGSLDAASSAASSSSATAGSLPAIVDQMELAQPPGDGDPDVAARRPTTRCRGWPPGDPAEQIEAFELKLVDMLCAQATPADRPRCGRQDLGSGARSRRRGPRQAPRRGVPRGARAAIRTRQRARLAKLLGRLTDLPELFDSRVKARSLAYCSRRARRLGLLTSSSCTRRASETSSSACSRVRGRDRPGVIYFQADRVVEWQLHFLSPPGTTILTLANYYTGTSTLYPVLYSWTALYAFYFFPLRAALAQMAFIGVAYAVVLADRGPGRAPWSAGCSRSARR